MNSDNTQLGELLKALRTERGLSQMDIEREAGIPQYLITNIERGRTKRPSFEDVVILGNVLGVTPTQIAAAVGLTTLPDDDWEAEHLAHELAMMLKIIREMATRMTESQQREFAIRLEAIVDLQRRDLERSDERQDPGALPRWLRRAMQPSDD